MSTLSYISLLHQTTTDSGEFDSKINCLISLFYIKPQPALPSILNRRIVLYLSSTSNHNFCRVTLFIRLLSYISLLHQTTTLFHLLSKRLLLSYISLLHQTTTLCPDGFLLGDCLISLFYIKPQQRTDETFKGCNCLISLFYIKPQLSASSFVNLLNCLISLFYIKPQLGYFSFAI